MLADQTYVLNRPENDDPLRFQPSACLCPHHKSVTLLGDMFRAHGKPEAGVGWSSAHVVTLLQLLVAPGSDLALCDTGHVTLSSSFPVCVLSVPTWKWWWWDSPGHCVPSLIQACCSHRRAWSDPTMAGVPLPLRPQWELLTIRGRCSGGPGSPLRPLLEPGDPLAECGQPEGGGGWVQDVANGVSSESDAAGQPRALLRPVLLSDPLVSSGHDSTFTHGTRHPWED